MQDLNDMRYFAEVVERGSFSAASRALGLPKSRLSRRIAGLESRLGVRLMQRTTRRLALTEVGELFYRHCAVVRDEADMAAETVARLQAEPRGVVRVSCPVTLAQTMLGPHLPAFLAAYPQVRLDMRVSNRAVDLVEEGLDVALRVRPTLADSGSLVVKRLGVANTVLVASPEQLTRQGRPRSPDELARLDTVAMSAVDGRTTWLLQGPDGQDYPFQHTPRLLADDLLSLRFAVLAGVGATYLPDYLCREDVMAGRLELVLPGWAPCPGIIHAVFPSRRGQVPAVRVFLDFLETALQSPAAG
ncbi:LysR family transcriptional regulator [Laribacter hongkongensis]|uniref:Transcriptional regulator, LysR family n=1 Tax=Laribacter hongkongensis TaxID=168471 RepID=A0A248LP52_9NEIS|nr:LysR family transcriptional regulator [Laribacter hongkongensis]ASJ26315.1 transcriptional regulator, LysR family [Laribacter hongkongensis]MCG9042114.1 LysR family transcriptional regulator [Laribacter hongkongensis]MCG9068542.1 LysR family transcriptional regulator [Laribacter hongkongensis]MCG9088042.1 LysR family transcriptional regulator [Laribacter hongkongensis]MCG9110604.1 LysR family transcriptional regulator [Laribacter hongkongensis]